MPNSWFGFKQFKVNHSLCAMKVGTDGVLLGAWCPLNHSEKNILDVGTGSGLIALMLAQRTNKAVIDAIDIDEQAVLQTKENFEESPWKDRLQVYHESLQYFAPKNLQKYDFVVSNPPYFVDSLKAPDKSRSLARHSDSLSTDDLLHYSALLTNETGRICLILPVYEGYQCVKLAEKYHLYCRQVVRVFPKPDSDAKRLLIELCKSPAITQTTDLTIESEQRHVYSEAFKTLVGDFYLRLK